MASATNDTVARAIEARRVPLSLLVPGDNPRRKLPEAKYVDELAESMKAHDVIEPLIVRPKGEKLQIVCGATRLLAAMKAGLPDVPVVVRQYDDLQVLEVQLIENIQRASMHPIDEGEAFRKLIASKKHTADSLASTLGKSIRWVYQRIAFAEDLVPEVKEAFAKDEITSKHAEILIRLDKKDQLKALKDGCFTWDDMLGSSAKRNVLASTSDLNTWIAENIERPAPVETLQRSIPEVAEAQAVVEAKGAKLLQLAGDWFTSNKKLQAGVLDANQYKRAGGRERCNSVERGVIVVGAGLGTVLDVCINRECEKHWPKPKPAAAAKKDTPGNKAARRSAEKKHDTWQQQQARDRAREEEWAGIVRRAKPVMFAALQTIKAVPTDLLRAALNEALPYGIGVAGVQKALGKNPLNDLGKALVAGWLLENRFSHYAKGEFTTIAKGLKVDLKQFEPKPAPKKGVSDPKALKSIKKQIDRQAKKRKAGKKR